MTLFKLHQIYLKFSDLSLRNKESLLAMIVRGAGVLAGFFVTFLIARWLGPEANGIYAIITQTAIFLSVVAVGGLDLVVVREFSKAVAEGRPLARNSIFGVVLQTCALSLILAIITLVLENTIIALLLGYKFIPHAAIILSILILLRALMRISAAILRSQGRFVASQVIELFLFPVLIIATLFFTNPTARDISTVLHASVAAGIIVVLIGIGMSFKESRPGLAPLRISQAKLFLGALPLWAMGIAQNLADWYGLVTINHSSGSIETGIYRVAWQISSVIPIVSLSLLTSFSAQIAAAAHASDRASMAKLSHTATLLSFFIFAPISICLFAFAEPILALFGQEFTAGAVMLRILIIGQLFISCFGIAGQVLVMTNRVELNLMMGIGTALLIVVFGPWAARYAGGLGIAALLSLSCVIRVVVFFVAVRRLERFNPFTGKIYP